MSGRTRFVIGVGVVAALVTIYALRQMHASAADGPTNSLSSEVAQRGFGDAARAATVGEFLAEYWGAEWTEREQLLDSETREKLKTPFDGRSMASWESIQDGVRESLRGELAAQRASWRNRIEREDEFDLNSPRLNPDGKSIPDDVSARISAIVAEHEPEIQALLDTSFDLTCEADERIWDERSYRTYPLIELPEVEPTRTTADS